MIVKRCGCGRTYTLHEWRALKYVGILDDGVERAELRNCVCGSTIALEDWAAVECEAVLTDGPFEHPRNAREVV